MAVAATVAREPSIPRPGKTTPVVLRRAPRAGTVVPAFGQDVWNLACIDLADNKSPPSLRFEDLQGSRKTIAKELMWQRINVPVASLRKRGKVKPWAGETCEAALGSLKRFLGFLDAAGIAHLHEVDQSVLDAFAGKVRATVEGKQQQASILKIVDCLYESGAHLTGGGLTFPPWGGRSTMQVVGYVRPEENATPRIPEAVLGGLLAWALAYVDHFAGDIIAAERFYRGADAPRTRLTSDAAAAALERYLEREVPLLGGIPAIRANPNPDRLLAARDLIARRAGVSRGWLAWNGAAALEAAIGRHGLLERFLPPIAEATAEAARLGPGRMSIAEMKQECRHLTVACYIVCAYLSGMRDSEVQMLTRTCLETIADERGRPFRFKLHGVTVKHQPVPKTVSWVVIAPVQRAIGVLCEVTAGYARESGDEHIFVRLHGASQSNALIKERMSAEIRDFAKHCTDDLAPLLRGGRATTGEYAVGQILDGPDGAPWHFTTSQFRRTMAWHIANRPFGVIAGMIQYKHASIQMFEGYAGTSKSDFRAEIEQQTVAARRQDVADLYTASIKGVLPAGPMAAELKAIFSYIAGRIGPSPCETTDDARTRKLVRNLAGRLYPGVLADCFYVPGEARCQRTTEPELRTEPVTGLCDPDCPSACWTAKHLPAWTDLEAQAEKLQRINKVSEEQRTIFTRTLEKIRARIAAIREASGGEG